MSQTNRRGPRAVAPTLVIGALGVLTAGVLTGCTGQSDDPQSGPTPAPSATTSTEPQTPISVKVGAVTGRLPRSERQEAADRVGEVVDRWYDAAYLGGDRSSSGGPSWAAAWPGFTRGAAAQARQDADLTSEPASGADSGSGEPVVPGTRGVRVDLLAVHQKAVGATAHVFLRFPVGERSVKVTGRLFLSPSAQGWQVFGYDLTKGAAR